MKQKLAPFILFSFVFSAVLGWSNTNSIRQSSLIQPPPAYYWFEVDQDNGNTLKDPSGISPSIPPTEFGVCNSISLKYCQRGFTVDQTMIDPLGNRIPNVPVEYGVASFDEDE